MKRIMVISLLCCSFFISTTSVAWADYVDDYVANIEALPIVTISADDYLGVFNDFPPLGSKMDELPYYVRDILQKATYNGSTTISYLGYHNNLRVSVEIRDGKFTHLGVNPDPRIYEEKIKVLDLSAVKNYLIKQYGEPTRRTGDEFHWKIPNGGVDFYYNNKRNPQIVLYI